MVLELDDIAPRRDCCCDVANSQPGERTFGRDPDMQLRPRRYSGSVDRFKYEPHQFGVRFGSPSAFAVVAKMGPSGRLDHLPCVVTKPNRIFVFGN